MTCLECGAEMELTIEDVRSDVFDAGITLHNLEVRRCPSCRETEYVIPDIEGMHRAIADAAKMKPGPLMLTKTESGWRVVDGGPVVPVQNQPQ